MQIRELLMETQLDYSREQPAVDTFISKLRAALQSMVPHEVDCGAALGQSGLGMLSAVSADSDMHTYNQAGIVECAICALAPTLACVDRYMELLFVVSLLGKFEALAKSVSLQLQWLG